MLPTIDTVPTNLRQAAAPTAIEVRRGRGRLHRKTLLISVIGFVGYYGFVISSMNFLVRLLIFSGMLLVGALAYGTCVMHDANHGSFSRFKSINRIVGFSVDLLGGSSWMWRQKHNQYHHHNTNVAGFDIDIEQAPFARLSPAQAWKPHHRYQHIYIWPLYGFYQLKWFLWSDFANLRRGNVGEHSLKAIKLRELATMIAGKLLHISWALIIPMFFNPWWGVLAFYLAFSWVAGILLVMIFQLAHCVDSAEFPPATVLRAGRDNFELHQLQTTVNVQCRVPVVRRFVRWIMGGLDFQIEHHLWDRVPHTVYPRIAPRLKALCEERGLPYKQHQNLSGAIAAHARHLKNMGKRPVMA
jgi:linoleoyl-CoA desaturase